MCEYIKQIIFGKDITPDLLTEKLGLIEEFYKKDFSKVRFRLGGLFPKIIPWNYAAIVFGKTINYSNGFKWLLNDDLTLAEELWHVVQWRDYGLITLPIKYLTELRRNGYSGNFYELEAKKMAKDFIEYKISKVSRNANRKNG